MSTRKKRTTKRTTADYLARAKAMAIYAPSLKKYRRRKTLSPQEKAAITRKEKALRFAYDLRPVNKQMAKELKDVLFAPGIQAVQFKNISPHAKVRRVKKDIYIESNGRTWVYWKLPEVDSHDMELAGEDIFNDSMESRFDIEKIEQLAGQAFRNPKARTVHLWTKQGRVGEGFNTLSEFMRWVYEDYSKYTDTERWVVGVAFLLDKDKKPKVEYKAVFGKKGHRPVTIYPKYVINDDKSALSWFDKIAAGYRGWLGRLYRNGNVIAER